MTRTLSFRAAVALADELDTVAAEMGVPRSELLHRAIRELLYRHRCETDADRYERHPLTMLERAPWPNEAFPDDDTDWPAVFGGEAGRA